MSKRGWEYVDAKVYYEKVTDGTHDSPKRREIGEYLITSKHIKNREIDFPNAYYISLDDYNKINERSKVDQWDVIISMIGEYCGFCYIEKNEKINYAVKNVGLFKTGDKSKAEWLYYYLNSSEGKARLLSAKTGSSQPYITLGALRDLKIKINTEENSMYKIVEVLSNIDNKIDLNNKINSELELMAKTLYDYWFVQFDFPNEEGKPYKSSGGAMAWNEELKREIPVGWEVENIEDNCTIVDCLHSKKPELFFEHEKYYLLQLNNILDNGLLDLSEKYYVTKSDYEEWTSRIEIENNDIVITNAGRVAANAQIPNYVKTGIGRNITAIRPQKVSPTYLSLAFRGLDLKRQIKWNTDSGAFFTSLNVKGIKKFHITRPPKNIEDKFEKMVYPFRTKREQNQKQNQELSSLRDWLLPMLMNGQVSVE